MIYEIKPERFLSFVSESERKIFSKLWNCHGTKIESESIHGKWQKIIFSLEPLERSERKEQKTMTPLAFPEKVHTVEKGKGLGLIINNKRFLVITIITSIRIRKVNSAIDISFLDHFMKRFDGLTFSVRKIAPKIFERKKSNTKMWKRHVNKIERIEQNSARLRKRFSRLKFLSGGTACNGH